MEGRMCGKGFMENPTHATGGLIESTTLYLNRGRSYHQSVYLHDHDVRDISYYTYMRM
jgi:hypothetical protein